MGGLYDQIRIACHQIWRRRWLAMGVAWGLCVLGWLVIGIASGAFKYLGVMAPDIWWSASTKSAASGQTK